MTFQVICWIVKVRINTQLYNDAEKCNWVLKPIIVAFLQHGTHYKCVCIYACVTAFLVPDIWGLMRFFCSRYIPRGLTVHYVKYSMPAYLVTHFLRAAGVSCWAEENSSAEKSESLWSLQFFSQFDCTPLRRLSLPLWTLDPLWKLSNWKFKLKLCYCWDTSTDKEEW